MHAEEEEGCGVRVRLLFWMSHPPPALTFVVMEALLREALLSRRQARTWRVGSSLRPSASVRMFPSHRETSLGNVAVAQSTTLEQ